MIDRKWIGYELPQCEFALERGRLRAFAAAIGEENPIYTDLEAARAAGYPDLPAPPTFLFSAELDAGTVMTMVEQMAIPLANLLHGEQGFTYHRAVCAGEAITVRSRVSDLQDKKGGALQIVIKDSEARNQQGELVAEMRTSLICRNK
jgi:acyl dehydratase